MLPGLDPPPGWSHRDWSGDAAVLDGVPRGRGSFLLTAADRRCVQLGGVEHLAARIRYYLTRPPPKKASRRRADLSGDVRHIWFRPAGSRLEYELDCLAVARAAWPQEYRERLELHPPSALEVDFDQEFPRITATDRAPRSAAAIGPFASRAAAGRYSELLEELFELCRCRQASAGPVDSAACVLRQLGRCPLPADQPAHAVEYRRRIDEALAFAAGADEPTRGRLTGQMNAAAEALEFERAARLKARIKLLAAVRAQEFGWVGRLSELCLVLVEPAATEGSWVAFHYAGGRVAAQVEFNAQSAQAVLTGIGETEAIENKSVTIDVLNGPDWDQTGVLVRHLLRGKSGPTLAVPLKGASTAREVLAAWAGLPKKLS